MKQKNDDILVKIGSTSVQYRGTDMVTPQPPVLEEKCIKAEGIDKTAVFSPSEKMTSKEQLQQELIRMRELYKPFMEDHSPQLAAKRKSRNLDVFDWRIETDEDKKDFIRILSGGGDWEKKKIPHYGGPLGKVSTYYRTEFDLQAEDINQGAVFICFKAVDYKAHVFMNGCYLGSHEGFFAPFEFEFSACARVGSNTLVVKVDNDFVPLENEAEWTNGVRYAGDKIYGATGMGYDDPERGWHHCPPGMGIYQDVYVEARPRVFIHDIFVRPMEDLESAEVWVEVFNLDVLPVDIYLELSLYGRNFTDIVFENLGYKPDTGIAVGLGDSLTESKLLNEGRLNSTIPLYIDKGVNRLIIPIKIPDARLWDMDTPWLYQIQVKLVMDETTIDTGKKQFGMRSFKLDMEEEPKGTFRMNNREIRLRGAVTMGHEQQCVAKGDLDQLRDDILLAKICNVNYFRLIHRPVQQEVYDYCDMLGLLLQTEMPLFAALSRSQFCEGVRQAAELERYVRSHPCNIMVDYVDEPFPNGMNKPQRNLTRNELEEFFKANDIVVRLNNPDRVIKHVDGDYDPPSTDLPDNHCYPLWYNGHGIDIGKLNKGYWMTVKPGWNYSCGEFGSEALDPVSVMKKYYPKEWLPQNEEEEKQWSPNRIKAAQTGNFHYFFFDTQDNLEDWVRESQKYQAWATRFMTEAFRRDNRMVGFALHLLIDAFPAGWMKAVMDVERTPKEAYFAYREVLAPLLPNFRTDRFNYYSGEEISLEAWICNDGEDNSENVSLKFMVEMDSVIIASAKGRAEMPACSSRFQGYFKFKAPDVKERTSLCIRFGLSKPGGEIINDTKLVIEVYPAIVEGMPETASIIGSNKGIAACLAEQMNLNLMEIEYVKAGGIILVDNYAGYKKQESSVLKLVEEGSKVLFLELEEGIYEIAGSMVEVKAAGMLPMHFVSRNTGHPLVEGFKPYDFKLWYDPAEDCITPIIDNTFKAPDFVPILTSGNTDDKGEWGSALAAAEKKTGSGSIFICQLKLKGRLNVEPAAAIFLSKLLK